MKNLTWNVYRENFNGKTIDLINILKYDFIKENLRELRNEYKKAIRVAIKEGKYVYKKHGDNIEIKYDKSFEEEFKQKIFAKRLKDILMHAFWGRSECEIILTSWPPYISMGSLDELADEIKESKYCGPIPKLEVARKIDIFDQIINNYEAFICYIWNNLYDANLKKEK